MNYEEMSDYEINIHVADLLGVMWAANGINLPDYCNNPSDAWPIIVENQISISWVGTYWQVLPPLLSRASAVRDDNPLRAAMIVYLMMQEAK